MTSRLYPAGTGNNTAPIEDCPKCRWRGPLSTLRHCERCGKHHPDDYKHRSERFGPYECLEPGCHANAVNHSPPGRKPQYGYHCAEHSVEDGDRIEHPNRVAMNHEPAFLVASEELAALMPQAEAPYPTPRRDDEAGYFEPDTDKSETVHRVDWLAGHAWCTCLGFLKHRRCKHADAEEEKHRK